MGTSRRSRSRKKGRGAGGGEAALRHRPRGSFKLAKDPAQAKRLDEVLYNLAEACRILAVLLHPVLPTTAEKIYKQLQLADPLGNLNAAKWGGLPAGHLIGSIEPLFPRKDR